jgi:hypothetical protein
LAGTLVALISLRFSSLIRSWNASNTARFVLREAYPQALGEVREPLEGLGQNHLIPWCPGPCSGGHPGWEYEVVDDEDDDDAGTQGQNAQGGFVRAPAIDIEAIVKLAQKRWHGKPDQEKVAAFLEAQDVPVASLTVQGTDALQAATQLPWSQRESAVASKTENPRVRGTLWRRCLHGD